MAHDPISAQPGAISPCPSDAVGCRSPALSSLRTDIPAWPWPIPMKVPNAPGQGLPPGCPSEPLALAAPWPLQIVISEARRARNITAKPVWLPLHPLYHTWNTIFSTALLQKKENMEYSSIFMEEQWRAKKYKVQRTDQAQQKEQELKWYDVGTLFFQLCNRLQCNSDRISSSCPGK